MTRSLFKSFVSNTITVAASEFWRGHIQSIMPSGQSYVNNWSQQIQIMYVVIGTVIFSFLYYFVLFYQEFNSQQPHVCQAVPLAISQPQIFLKVKVK